MYKANKDSVEVYTGITKQEPEVRLRQHNSPSGGNKGFDDLIVRHKNLTRNQARAIETYYIKQNKGMNKILSISENNKFSKLAEAWAKTYVGG